MVISRHDERVWLEKLAEDGPDAAGVDSVAEPPESTPLPDMRPVLGLVGAFGLAYYFALIRHFVAP